MTIIGLSGYGLFRDYRSSIVQEEAIHQFIDFAEFEIGNNNKDRMWQLVAESQPNRYRIYIHGMDKVNDVLYYRKQLNVGRAYREIMNDLIYNGAFYGNDSDTSFSYYAKMGSKSLSANGMLILKLLAVKDMSSKILGNVSSPYCGVALRESQLSGENDFYKESDTLKGEVFVSMGNYCRKSRVISFEVNDELFTDIDTLINFQYKIPKDYPKNKMPVTIISLEGRDTVIVKKRIRL